MQGRLHARKHAPHAAQARAAAADPHHHRHRTASARPSSIIARVVCIAMAALLSLSVAAPHPIASGTLSAATPGAVIGAGVAFAQEANLADRTLALRATVESAQAEYLSAIRTSEELASSADAAQAELDAIEAELSEKRERLSEILVSEYKSPSVGAFISAISHAGSLTEALRQFEYANIVVKDRADTVSRIRELSMRAQEGAEAIAMREAEAASAAEMAAAAREVWQGRLDAMAPELQAAREEHWASVAGTSGNDQMESALDYLGSVDGMTEVQEAIIRSAYRTPYAGGARCEAWVEAVYRNAGISINRYAGAAQCAKALTRSDDLDAIPVGALVFGSGSSSALGQRYGHVGICVASGTGKGDALIIDNEGSRTKRAVPLSEWSARQTSVSWVSGKQGAFAWGYPDSIALRAPSTAR